MNNKIEYFYTVTLAADLKIDYDKLSSLAISEFGCEGIEEFSLEEPQVDELLGERSYSGGDLPESVIDEVNDKSNHQENEVWKFYFYTENAEEKAKIFYESLKLEIPDEYLNLLKSNNEDWNTNWRDSFKSIEVNKEFVVVPQWDEKEYSHQHILKIYPGMGFGTGGHQTTFLCLKALLDEEQKKDFSVLDFGCGSGILGIAAKILNCKELDLLDIDEDALENTRQNLTLNEFNEGQDIRLFLSNEKDKLLESYDLVFANILRDVLLLEKDFLIKKTNEGGRLIISGLLEDQENEIVEAYSKDLSFEGRKQKDEWIALVFKK